MPDRYESPDAALRLLMEGNLRFVEDRSIAPNVSGQRRAELAQGQAPFASVLGCADSRVPLEIVFDRGLGDLFVVRTAGQVVGPAVLGSLEFGANVLNIPLIFVLGHERCGAVQAAMDAGGKPEAPGAIGSLIEAIAPAVASADPSAPDPLDAAVRANVENVVWQLGDSPILSGLLAQGRLRIVGGRYELATGRVEVTVG